MSQWRSSRMEILREYAQDDIAANAEIVSDSQEPLPARLATHSTSVRTPQPVAPFL